MAKITRDMKISDIMEQDPSSIDTLLNIGMGCIGCWAAQEETLEQACEVHGIDVDDVVKELNKEANDAKKDEDK